MHSECRAPKELASLLAEIDSGAFNGWAGEEPGEEQQLFLASCAVERKQTELQRAASAAAASQLHGDAAVSTYWTGVQADLQRQIEALQQGMDLQKVERGEHLPQKESSQPAPAASSSQASLRADSPELSSRKKGAATRREVLPGSGLVPSPPPAPATQKSSVSVGARSVGSGGGRSRAASVGARSGASRSVGGARSRRVSSSSEEEEEEEESSSEEDESEDDDDD